MKKKLNCILIIDDDEPTNFISRMLIEEAGCTEHIHISSLISEIETVQECIHLKEVSYTSFVKN
ncbi:MAG TPA: hypothetical protein VKC90_08455 [Chitinophagaceae bacterium]|nr:hypothetical protein [Chitinophagaceae bacterium]